MKPNTSITFNQLKKIIFESIESNKFEVGCKYRWWSKNPNWDGGEFIVTEIAPDRLYILVVSTNNKYLDAKKYKVIGDGNGGEKISDHPAAYAWRVARADKGGEYVGVPDGWYSREAANRKAGAAKASTTKSIKSTLTKLVKNAKPEHFYKLIAQKFRGDSNLWKEVQEVYKSKGLDSPVYSESPFISKGRGPKAARGKLSFFFTDIRLVNGGTSALIGYDGDRFYFNWSPSSDGISDEKIREIFSDIL